MRQLTLGDLTVRLTGGDDGNGGGDGPMVVLLHGFGAPGTDLIPLAGELGAAAGTRFAFPEAPLDLPFQMGGGIGKAWWMIDVMRLQMAMLKGDAGRLLEDVPDGMAEANGMIETMLDALDAEVGVNPQQLILGGFSQGSMLALDVVLRSQRALSGLVIMSGTFVAREQWLALMDTRADLPVLMSHGRSDPLLPFQVAEMLRDALVGAGLPVTWVPFGGGHGIGPSVLHALSDFITLNTQVDSAS